MLDAIRKIVSLTANLSYEHGLTEWRQSNHQLRAFKRKYRTAQQIKRSNSNNEKVKEAKEIKVIEAYQEYLGHAKLLLIRVHSTLEKISEEAPEKYIEKLAAIFKFIDHAERQIDQIERRVMNGQKIPHNEKVFSLFEEHTEWINKGKAGVPVELGLRVCIMESHAGYILHHQVMQATTDDKVAIEMVIETQLRFPDFNACSFDKGFHSPENQQKLDELLGLVHRFGRAG